ncbi:nucleotidyltransferase family protein [Candidatus Micrarchaeota archaeon]|nr:nucleotidyltransferase family protein [Candidatus Micrarchaeota archaeon]
MQDIQNIKKKLQSSKEEMRKRFGVKSIGVFGSYVTGKQKTISDVDVLVEFETTPSLMEFLELEGYLTSLLDVKVDLVMRTALKPKLGERILKEVVYL